MRDRLPRILLLFFLVGLVALLPFGQKAQSQDGKSFLWKVQSGESTVYLLGSIHFLKKENYPLSPKIENAFEASDRLVVEANIQDQDKISIPQIMEKAIYPPDERISAHLSKETYELLKKEGARLGLPPEMTDRQRPWFLSMSLEALEILKLGYDPAYGVDSYFLSKASGKKTILELESVEEQLNLLANLSAQDQEFLLLLTLKDLQNVTREMDSLIQSWKSGDPKGMEPVITKSIKEDPRLSPVYEKLIYERNRKMLSKIEEYLNGSGTYFVVVGAGHLIGEKGIIETLRRRGHRVEQL